MKKLRVVVIGIDGATWNLIKPWAEEGKLPTFKKFIEEGAWGSLESTIPPSSAPAWVSIFTGVSPGKHSIYSFGKRIKGSYFSRPLSSRDIKAEPIWRILTMRNKKGIFINIPLAYPVDKVNGILISGLLTPSKTSNFTYPQFIKDIILRKFPNYDVDFNEDEILYSKDKNFIINRIYEVTKAHIETFKYFFKSEKADIYFIVLRSTDVIQHFFWHKKDILLKFYKQIDEFLDWIIKFKDENDIVIICSDHGFQGVKKRIYLNKWLEKEGFLRVRRKRIYINALPLLETIILLFAKLKLKRLLWYLKRNRYLLKMLRFLPSKAMGYINIIDWSKTLAYAECGSEWAIIWINLKGKFPRGIVDGSQFEEIREKIINKIRELNDPETGESVVMMSKKGEDIYGNIKDAPHIVLLPKDGYVFRSTINNPSIFEYEYERTGEHSLRGIIAFYGKYINKGEFKGIKVYDIVPTILALLGLPIPTYVDGKVLKDIFKKPLKIKYKPNHHQVRIKIQKLLSKLNKDKNITK